MKLLCRAFLRLGAPSSRQLSLPPLLEKQASASRCWRLALFPAREARSLRCSLALVPFQRPKYCLREYGQQVFLPFALRPLLFLPVGLGSALAGWLCVFYTVPAPSGRLGHASSCQGRQPISWFLLAVNIMAAFLSSPLSSWVPTNSLPQEMLFCW